MATSEKDLFYLDLYQTMAEHGMARPSRAKSDRLYKATGGDVGQALDLLAFEKMAKTAGVMPTSTRKQAASKRRSTRPSRPVRKRTTRKKTTRKKASSKRRTYRRR